MAHIYIALVDTPGIFATLIRFFLKQRYIHVVLALDKDLKEAYSFGRRNPFIPVFAGFEREEKEKIVCAFPTAQYKIYRLNCNLEQKNQIKKRLQKDYQRRYHFHYAIIGLFFLVLGRKFYIKNQYTCSSYIARVLKESGIVISSKHFSLVTPKDFYEYQNMDVIFEGKLSELIDQTKIPKAEHVVAQWVSIHDDRKDFIYE